MQMNSSSRETHNIEADLGSLEISNSRFFGTAHLQLLLMRHTPEGLKIIYKMNLVFSANLLGHEKRG